MNTVTIQVAELVALAGPLQLALVAGQQGVGRRIQVPRIQKPGLALSGWDEQLHPGRVLVLGGTEMDYLESVEPLARETGVTTLLESDPACVIVCRGRVPDLGFKAACDRAKVPLLTTPLLTAELIVAITRLLTDELAPACTVHAVLLDVVGVGVLLIGKSGIGKSETALDLVVRGHRLIADDVVELWAKGAELFGTGPETIRHQMEIRGLGIINIKDLFGISSVRDNKRVELVVELVEWDDKEEYDRLGLDSLFYEVLGTRIPRLRIPVRQGRNLSTLVEVAVRNQLLKNQGHHSAQAFHEQLTRALTRPRTEGGA